MKKTAIIIFSVILVLALAIPSFAANSSSGLNRNSTRSFIDANGDGVCDNYGTGRNCVDADGDGVCDNCGTGRNCVDADGDGVCDNCPNGGVAQHNGTGMHYGRGGYRR